MEYGEFKDLNKEGVDRLVEAMVKLAVNDWKSAMRILKRFPDAVSADSKRAQCERFFLSDYFYLLTGLNGKHLIDKLEEEFNAS